MSGPGKNETAAAAGLSRGHLRASHADREQVIGTLKAAFVEGRLTEDELDARVDQVYASRTYAELAEVTADIPAELTSARPARDPWRATKVAWGVVYALILPGLFTLVALPGGPAPLTVGKVVTVSAIVYAVFWILGVCVMVASRLGKRPGGQLPPRSAPGAGGLREALVITEPGDEIAAGAGGGGRLPECHADREHREQVIRTLKAALVQGRLTEDEYDTRAAQASASRSHTELAALTADLPVGWMDAPARAPAASDVRVGVGVIIAAAGVIAALLLTNFDNALAFMTFIVAAVTLLVAPIVTVGLMFDVRHQKRSGGQLPPGPAGHV